MCCSPPRRGSAWLWQVVVLALLFGTLSAAGNPARQAFVQEVVGRDLVRDAVTLNSTTASVARVIGPTIAAVLVSTIGIGLVLRRERGELQLRHRLAARPGHQPLASDPAGTPGSRRVARGPAVRGACSGDRPAAADDGANRHVHVRIRGQPAAAGPHHVPRRRHRVQLAARRPGRRGGRRRPVRRQVGSHRSPAADLGRALLCDRRRALGGRSHHAGRGRRVRAGRRGAASVTFLTTGNATIQLASEARYRGRVTAPWSMAFVGSTPIGAPIVGALSDIAGPRYALALGAVACLAAVVTVAVLPGPGRTAGSPDLHS